MAVFVSYSASWISISAARHDGLWYGLGKGGFVVSEYVVKIGLSVIGFARDTVPSAIDPGGLFNFLVSKNSRASLSSGNFFKYNIMELGCVNIYC